MSAVVRFVKEMAPGHRDNVFWAIALLALLPAIKAGTLFPTSWIDPFTGEYLITKTPDFFGWYAIAIGALAIVFAGQRLYWLAWLVAITHWVSSFASSLDALGILHAVLSLSVFVCFVLRGRTNSLAFLAFVLALVWLVRSDDALTWPPVLVTLAVILVIRIVVEAFSQNWPLVKQLGKNNFFTLTARTLTLWWPMLILIGAGIWLGEALKHGAENALYAEDIITPYCSIDAVGDDAILACTRERLQLADYEDIVLREKAFRRMGSRDAINATRLLQKRLVISLDQTQVRTEINALRKAINSGDRREALAALKVVERTVNDQASDSFVIGTLKRLQLRELANVAARLRDADAEVWSNQCVLNYYNVVEVQNAPAGAPFTCPEGLANADGQEVSADSDATPPPEREFTLTRIGFFDSAYRSIDYDYAKKIFTVERSLSTARAKAGGNIHRARREAEDMFTLVPEDTGMKTRTCGFLEVKCGASNYVIDELNDAYEKQRTEAHRAYVEELDDLQADANTASDKFLTNAANALVARIESARELSLASVRRIEVGAHVIGVILQLLLIVAIVKSLLYVFARVIFDKDTKMTVDLSDSAAPLVQGTVRHTAEIEIPKDYPLDIYYKPNFQPLGPAARFSIPQWSKSWLARIRYGAWHMSRAEFPLTTGTGLTFNAVEAEHLVDWEMKPGEEVMFSYNNFVAINSNVELNTVISLRVSNLLLGRMIWHTARCTDGPGRLILRTRGKPASAAQVQQSIPAARLIAFDRNARFSIDSHLTPQDVFLNGFNLSRSEDDDASSKGILIVEADARDGGLLVGTLRFARNFLLPI